MQSFPEVVETDWQWLIKMNISQMSLVVESDLFFQWMVCGDYVHESVYR